MPDPVGNVVEDVEARDPLLRQQARRFGLRLLQDRGEKVPLAHLAAARALDVQHRRLQDAPECEGLLGLAAPPARSAVDLVLQDVLEGDAQRLEIGAAGREYLLPLEVEGQHVEHVLERQVRVAPR